MAFRRYCAKSASAACHVFAAVVSAVFGLSLAIPLGIIIGGARLDTAVPFLERELTDALGSPTRVDGVKIRWSRWSERFTLHVQGVTLLDGDGDPIVRAPEIDVDLDWPGIMAGQSTVRGVTLRDLSLYLRIGPAGTLGARGFGGMDEVDVVDLLDGLLRRANGSGVDHIELMDSTVLVTARERELPLIEGLQAELSLRTQRAMLRAQAYFARQVSAPIDVNAVFDARAGSLLGTVAATNVHLQELLGTEGLVGGTMDVDLRLEQRPRQPLQARIETNVANPMLGERSLGDRAKLSARFDTAPFLLQVDSLALESDAPGGASIDGSLTARPGEEATAIDLALNGVRLPDLLGDAPPIETLTAQLSVASDFSRMDVETFLVRLAGADLRGKAAVSGFHGSSTPALQVSARLEGALTKSELLAYWPVRVVGRARSWVSENVLEGRLTGGELTIDAPPGALEKGLVNSGALDLRFSFADGLVRFMRALPPVDRVTGQGRIQGTELEVSVPNARMRTSTLENMRVYAPRVDDETTFITVTGEGTDQSASILSTLDSGELALSRRFGLKPETVGGTAEVQFTFQRPMRQGIDLSDMRIGATAILRDMSVPNVFAEADLTNGFLTLEVDNDGINAHGGADLFDVPVSLIWTTGFRSSSGSEFWVRSSISPWELDPLGLANRLAFAGSADLTIRAKGRGVKAESARLEADLTTVAMRLPELDWSKDRGEPAKAFASVDLSDAGGVKLQDLSFESDTVRFEGSLDLGADGRLVRADIPVLEAGDRLDVSMQAWRLDDDGLRVVLDGAYFDPSPWLAQDGTTMSTEPTAVSADWRVEPDLVATIRVDRFGDPALQSFENVSLDVALGAAGLERFSMVAGIPGSEDAVVGRLTEPMESGARRLLIRADDAGAFFRGVFRMESISGGTLDLDALIDPAEPDRLTGTLRLQEMRLRDAPVFAQILAAASLDGLVQALSDPGLAIARAEAEFVIEDGQLIITEGVARGGAVGVTLRGILAGPNGLDLVGVVAPLYGVNSVLGVVPLLGDVLTSRDGEGILGVVFALQGRAADPRIEVSAMSLLAPGFLRRLFELPYEDALAAARGAADEAEDPSAASAGEPDLQ